ncbi:hypothetical protein BDM02DRAFT_3191128 [Thelephora ganbajun]|uniref:Uncharacterized protein n=1 Tax=Thelephora ganbajun TaxID=370292 RepID=A0ACB6Z2S3_THEGA|nr:hypothetical protein BDM02DRAFT_3191128 [Thelephora ganbajun]
MNGFFKLRHPSNRTPGCNGNCPNLVKMFIRYSAVVADRLWSLFEAKRSRNDRLEQDLNSLKGMVSLLNTRLLAVDRHSFDANKKVNDELAKDSERLNHHRRCVDLLQEKHNGLVMFTSNLSDSIELHRRSLIALRDRMCTCERSTTPPVDGSGAAPSFSHSPPSSRPWSPPTPAVETTMAESETLIVAPTENAVPVPVPPLCCAPRRTVVESTTTLQVISEEEERALEDRLVAAMDSHNRAPGVVPSIPVGSESSENSAPRCDVPVVTLSREQMETLSPGARGYRLLSVMRAVMMMPNSTVYNAICLTQASTSALTKRSHESLRIYTEMELANRDLTIGLLRAHVNTVAPMEIDLTTVEDETEEEESEVVWSGAQVDDEELEYSDGWVTDRSVDL